MLDRNPTSVERAAVEARLAVLERQSAASRAARKVEDLIEASRLRDRQVPHVDPARPAAVREGSDAYDARGMLQRTSREFEGRRLYALIGGDGHAVAYLQIPPGLNVRDLLGHRVGVNGDSRYDEELRARLILVRELERWIATP